MRLLSFVLFLLGLPVALATSFIEQPFPEAVKDVPVIVRGKVGASGPEWGVGSDGSRRIYTYYHLSVDEVLKGSAPQTLLQMREMGGEKDGVGMHVSGTAQFNRGEEVVVFLSDRNSDGSFDVRGLMMGKLNVQRGESGAEILTGPALGGASDGHAHGAREGQADPSGHRTWTLEALRQVIRTQGTGSQTGEREQKPAKPQESNSPVAVRQEPPSQAPQLQPDSSGSPRQGGSDSTTRGWGLMGFGIALFLGLGLLGILKRSGKK